MNGRLPLIYLALLAIAVPWYWPADDTMVWFGAPAWVVVAVVVSLIASILTAVLMSKPWPHERDDD